MGFCDRDRIRTCDRLLRRQMLYPAELLVHLYALVPGDGLEPSRPFRPTDFKSVVSTNSTTRAYISDISKSQWDYILGLWD